MEIEATLEKGDSVKIVCPYCGGLGERIRRLDDDEFMEFECKPCKGEGIKEAIIAEDQVFYEEIDEGELFRDMEPARMEGL